MRLTSGFIGPTFTCFTGDSFFYRNADDDHFKWYLQSRRLSSLCFESCMCATRHDTRADSILKMSKALACQGNLCPSGNGKGGIQNHFGFADGRTTYRSLLLIKCYCAIAPNGNAVDVLLVIDDNGDGVVR